MKQFFIEEGKKVTCKLTIKHGLEFIGEAKCHEDDKEFFSPLTGQYIAEQRAIIKGLKYSKKEQKEKLKILSVVKLQLDSVKEINKKERSYRILSNNISEIEDVIKVLDHLITTTEAQLKIYLAEKEIFYIKLKKIRSKTHNKI